MPKLVITGASGHLGGVLAAHATAEGWEVTGTFLAHRPPARTAWEARVLDVRDAGAVDALIALQRPDAVIHTAYLQDGDQAAQVTTDGARHVAVAAARAGARLVHLSSDAVFTGDVGRGLREDDAPDPITAYGELKAAAEVAVAAAHPGPLAVRTSLLYGGPGRPASKHEELALAVARGQRTATFFADEIRCPVQVDDLAGALLELAAGTTAGVLNVAGADAVDRHAFARLVVAAEGLDASGLAAGPRPAGRPGDCTLDSSLARRMLRTRLRGVHEVLAPR